MVTDLEGPTSLEQLQKLIQAKEDDLARWRAVHQALAAREGSDGSQRRSLNSNQAFHCEA